MEILEQRTVNYISVRVLFDENLQQVIDNFLKDDYDIVDVTPIIYNHFNLENGTINKVVEFELKFEKTIIKENE